MNYWQWPSSSSEQPRRISAIALQELISKCRKSISRFSQSQWCGGVITILQTGRTCYPCYLPRTRTSSLNGLRKIEGFDRSTLFTPMTTWNLDMIYILLELPALYLFYNSSSEKKVLVIFWFFFIYFFFYKSWKF